MVFSKDFMISLEKDFLQEVPGKKIIWLPFREAFSLSTSMDFFSFSSYKLVKCQADGPISAWFIHFSAQDHISCICNTTFQYLPVNENQVIDIFCHILKWFQIQAAGNLARLTLLCIARIIRNQQNHTLTTWRLGNILSRWTIFQAGFRTLRRCRENLICGVLFNVIEFSASSAIKCCTCETAILQFCASSLVIQYVHLHSLAIGK